MLSTSPIYLIFFTSGLAVGFGHCIGMCGPIVISLSLNIRDRSSLFPDLFYNFGRTITYGILGAIMGGPPRLRGLPRASATSSKG